MPTADGMILIPSITHITEFLNNESRGKVEFKQPDADGKAGLRKFELTDVRMERLLRHYNSRPDQQFEKEIKFFRLPTNVDLRKQVADPILTGYVFPRWGICSQHKGFPVLMEFSQDRWDVVLECPSCKKQNKKPVRGSPVRFVQACSNGHLEDLYWHGLVHYPDKSCKNKIFHWKELGGGDNFSVQCTECGMDVSYVGERGLKTRSVRGILHCSGQFPEKTPYFDPAATCEPVKTKDGNKSLARLVLRNSAGLHTSKLLTTIEIPKFTGALYDSLYGIRQLLNGFVIMKPDWKKSDLLSHLENPGIKDLNLIPNDTIWEIDRAGEDELAKATENIKEEMHRDAARIQLKPISESEANYEELTSLLEAAREGYPPDSDSEGKRAFVNVDDIEYVQSKEFGVTFRVTPIRDIRVTKVQVGYSREISAGGDDMDRERIGKVIRDSCYYDDGNTRWYLGDQMKGEAIFVDIYDEETHMGGLDPLRSKESADLSVWSKISEQKITERDAEPKGSQEHEEKNIMSINADPRFVWWHSFCHNLLQNLCVDSGFTVVSLGERVYCKKSERNGSYESGILIYTAATGADGTLGGLVSLVEKKFMTEIFRKTAEGIRSCSNDPVCSAISISESKITGSCCHACELVPETTCAYQNKFLDRNIVKGTLDDG